ncbi:hypothetical protein AVEN_136955-1 [Araneus ventricosus]|uniref:Uncharacterized protein n=1 Tax=Araneus ventricosus TaxID=182803 RepID=A0A4Y2BID1_ARAVE|nr:hypothetical protein AVEN_136955-1 [Araneus ventricosus]
MRQCFCQSRKIAFNRLLPLPHAYTAHPFDNLCRIDVIGCGYSAFFSGGITWMGSGVLQSKLKRWWMNRSVSDDGILVNHANWNIGGKREGLDRFLSIVLY